MILSYLQLPVRYEQLLKRLKISAIGTRFTHLHHLQSFGILVSIGQGDFNMMKQCLAHHKPIIAFIDTGELHSYWNESTAHAVVVVGIDDLHVYLNDPEFEDAPQKVSIEEFALAWLEKDYVYAVLSRPE